MRKRKDRTIRGLAQAPREQMIEQIIRGISKKKIRSLVEWSLEVADAAQEFRLGEAEPVPAFIRRLGAGLRASCGVTGHPFEAGDPRCLRCGEPNPEFIPPAGTADASLPASTEVH